MFHVKHYLSGLRRLLSRAFREKTARAEAVEAPSLVRARSSTAKRSLPIILISGLALLAMSCGYAAAEPRGWAAPVQAGDLLLVSTAKGKLDALRGEERVWRFP